MENKDRWLDWAVESCYFGPDELPGLAEEKNNREQIRMCFEA